MAVTNTAQAAQACDLVIFGAKETWLVGNCCLPFTN